jgi:curved DNA-binding protein
MLSILELEYPFTPTELLRQYRTLVRKYHPDLNPDDDTCHEKIKMINQAYETLKKVNTH